MQPELVVLEAPLVGGRVAVLDVRIAYIWLIIVASSSALTADHCQGEVGSMDGRSICMPFHHRIRRRPG